VHSTGYVLGCSSDFISVYPTGTEEGTQILLESSVSLSFVPLIAHLLHSVTATTTKQTFPCKLSSSSNNKQQLNINPPLQYLSIPLPQLYHYSRRSIRFTLSRCYQQTCLQQHPQLLCLHLALPSPQERVVFVVSPTSATTPMVIITQRRPLLPLLPPLMLAQIQLATTIIIR
jgi:hypothetical protein